MSTLTYNGITIDLLKTRMIGRDNEWSPDRSDQLYVRHTFDVEGIINVGATAYSSVTDSDPVSSKTTKTTFPVISDIAIREKLMEPRKTLTFANNGVTLLQSPLPGAGVDALNGPKPISFDILAIHGIKTFMVSYRIETWVSECEDLDDAAADPLLSNRYDISHQVDDQRMTTIQSTGTAIFRMDALQMSATGNADHFRNRCLPPLPIGFQRKMIRCAVNPVGNMLSWSCIDQEMFYSVGQNNKWGVETFEAIYTQSSNPVEGGAGHQSIFDLASLDVHVVGNKTSSRYNLILFALALAVERLGIKAGPVVNVDPMTRQVQISERMHDRIVDLRVSVMLPVSKQGPVGIAGVNGARVGVDTLKTLANDGTNNQMPFDSNTRGTYTGELFAAALQAACSRIDPVKPSPGQSQGTSDTPTQNYAPPYVETTVVPNLTNQSSRYSTATTSSGVYTDYKVSAQITEDTGTRLCQKAGPKGTAPAMLSLGSGAIEAKFTWSVERNGTKPLIPERNHNDQRMTRLKSVVRPTEIYLAPDGQTPVYRIEGEYTYGWNAPASDFTEIPFPVVPWTNFNYGDTTLNSDDYSHYIIDGPVVSAPSSGDPPEDPVVGNPPPGYPTSPTPPPPPPPSTPPPPPPPSPSRPYDPIATPGDPYNPEGPTGAPIIVD